jgi:uncharacterized protein
VQTLSNLFFSLILASLCVINSAQANFDIPKLTAPVMDQADFLSQSQEEDLNSLAYEIYKKNGPQIAILTVPDLQGLVIEDFSIRVAESWKLGDKKAGNGLLIIIAKAERKMRIEVGEGLEGDITDYDSNQYIVNILAPAFKQGLFHSGLRIVLEKIARKVNIEITGKRPLVRRASPTVNLPPLLVKAFPFVIIFLILGQIFLSKWPVRRGLFTGSTLAGVGFFLGGAGLAMLGLLFVVGTLIGVIGLHNLLYALASGSGRGGYSSGGFGGGGGWSGGGGGFSGGGSSGSW